MAYNELGAGHKAVDRWLANKYCHYNKWKAGQKWQKYKLLL